MQTAFSFLPNPDKVKGVRGKRERLTYTINLVELINPRTNLECIHYFSFCVLMMYFIHITNRKGLKVFIGNFY